MKRPVSLLLAVLLTISMVSCVFPAARGEMKKITILVYLCGTDLESEGGEATRDIREMLSSGIGNSGDVTVLLATGGCRQWQRYGISSRSVQYYRLGSDSPELLRDAGKRSMGEADTLAGFLEFGLSYAPAERYILILWDHGGGPVYGLCNDENFQDDSLSLSELRAGLVKGLNGARLDVIGFDCCLMNCVDLCADLYGIADHAVLSQEMVSGTGLNYDEWMRPLIADPGLSSQSIAISIADTYVAENSRGRNADTVTMSVIDVDRMPAVMDAANAFSAALSALMGTNAAGVIRLRTQLTSFGEFLDEDASDLVDVEDLCDAFSALLPKESAALREAARQAVSYNRTTSDIASFAHGLSFFMPYETAYSERQEILAHYGKEDSAYASLAVAMAQQTSASGYSMSASSYTPSSFYSHDTFQGGSSSGALCDIWNGYYGEYYSFDQAYSFSGGDIWAGLDTETGSVWADLSSSGIWAGYGSAGSTPRPTSAPAAGIWAGLTEAAATPAPAASAASALNGIWAGLMNTGADYYQPGEENQNVQSGVSEAVSAEDVLETANTYFSSAALTAQMIYSIQLNKSDLDHLSAASGVLSIRKDGEVIRLGNLGQTTIDWSTGLVFSMFDGSWPMLEGQMVRAEFLYGDENGNMRFVIPAKVNGLKMYLLGYRSADGTTQVLGATQGYDENGFAIRGSIPLEAGMTVYPLFTAVSPDGTEREYAGSAVIVPKEGLTLAWSRIPGGSYQYCFGLSDLSGQLHYTDSVTISF